MTRTKQQGVLSAITFLLFVALLGTVYTANAQSVPDTTGPQPPTARVPAIHSPLVLYFPEVGHTLRFPFREYWSQNGGLAQFGYPLTEQYNEVSKTDGKTYLVQYFERARMEYHPENAAPNSVLLGLLGRTATAGREGEAAFKPVERSGVSGAAYFEATRHNLAPQFAAYWQRGGLAVYGYPISEAFTEVSKADGKRYLVQYFERNRMEYHPELPDAFRVSLGLLGAEALR